MGNAAAAGLGILIGGALFAGQAPFAVVVVAAGAVLLVDVAAALSESGARPVTVAAGLPAIVLPIATLATPGAGWSMLPDFVAAGTLGAFALVLVFGRRRGVTAALGATALAGLTVGLGATGLLLLRDLPDGVPWVLGVLVVVVAVDTVRTTVTGRAKPLSAAAATVATALVGAGLLSATANPPFGLFTAAGTAAVALLAAPAGGLLREGLADASAAARADAGVSPHRARSSTRAGALTAATLPVMLAVPAVYALARLAAL